MVNRVPMQFDEQEYLRLNQDVADAVRAGHLSSAWEHVVKFGYREHRQGISAELSAFIKDNYPHYQIEGWLEDFAADITKFLLSLQEEYEFKGTLLEIGVFAGKYLLLLVASAAKTGDHVVGIDTFQYHSQEQVLENIERVMPSHSKFITLLGEPSTSFTADRLLEVLHSRPRFISVDGSHEWQDVLHDLCLSDAVLSDEGIIAVDDFLNPHAIGVNRAVNSFMEREPNLAGVAYITNKLFLARPGKSQLYRKVIEDHLLQDTMSDQGKLFNERIQQWRGLIEQSFFGGNILLVP